MTWLRNGDVDDFEVEVWALVHHDPGLACLWNVELGLCIGRHGEIFSRQL